MKSTVGGKLASALANGPRKPQLGFSRPQTNLPGIFPQGQKYQGMNRAVPQAQEPMPNLNNVLRPPVQQMPVHDQGQFEQMQRVPQPQQMPQMQPNPMMGSSKDPRSWGHPGMAEMGQLSVQPSWGIPGGQGMGQMPQMQPQGFPGTPRGMRFF